MQSHGYTYKDLAEAERIAEQFDGVVIEIEFDGWKIITKTN